MLARVPDGAGRRRRGAPATMAGIYYWIVIHEDAPMMAAPAVLVMPYSTHEGPR